MTKQEISLKQKGFDYKAFHAYLKGYRMPKYVTYMRMYFTIYGFNRKESEIMARQAFNNFLSVFIDFYDKGYTYLWMEDITGLSHAGLHKYIKRKVDDIELYTLVTLIERLNLDISIPGIIDAKNQKK